MTMIKLSSDNKQMQRVLQESEYTGQEVELFRETMEKSIVTLGEELVQANLLLVESESRYKELNLACEEEITALEQELAELELLIKGKETTIAENARKAKEELQKEVARTTAAVAESANVAQRSASARIAAQQQNSLTLVAQQRAYWDQQLQVARSNTASYDNLVADSRSRLNNDLTAANNCINSINAGLSIRDFRIRANIPNRTNHNQQAQASIAAVYNDLNHIINIL